MKDKKDEVIIVICIGLAAMIFIIGMSVKQLNNKLDTVMEAQAKCLDAITDSLDAQILLFDSMTVHEPQPIREEE